MKRTALALFVAALCVYSLTAPTGNTFFNHFVYLAQSFLHGHFYLPESASGLTELIPGKLPGQFYVAYPPMPAIVLMPFVALFGINFPQQYIAHLLGAGIAPLSFFLSYHIKKDYKLALWSSLLLTYGSIVWFLSSNGWVWYLGQVTACFFMLLALVEVTGKKRGFWVGIFLGCAYLSRIHTILSLPLFVYLLKSSRSNLLSFVSGVGVCFLFNLWYNFARFGNIVEQGYALIPGVFGESWYDRGLVSPSYMLRNIKTALFSFPKILDGKPWIEPSWWGLSIWITTPAFIFSFKAPFKKISTKLLWFACFFIFSLVLMHGTNGFVQFGYRHAVDFYPFLFFLTILGVMQQKGPRKLHWIFLIVSIVVNLWGVIWINKLGWVSF